MFSLEMSYMILANNSLEKAILRDEYFQSFLTMGRSRNEHPEGLLGIHVQHVLEAIDELPDQRRRAMLRLGALLHDVGKLAGFESKQDYRPDGAGEEQIARLVQASRSFRQEFPYHATDDYVPEHALYSVEFARRFVSDTELLDLIKYHDTGLKIYDHAIDNQDALLLHYFGEKDAGLFVLFSYVDAADREKTKALWMQSRFRKLGLLSNDVI